MNCRCLASLSGMALAIGLTVGLLAPLPMAGQAQSYYPKPAGTKPWTQKTPDGHPDLQGYWTNNSYTPLQRPANAKELYNPEELEAANKTRAAQQAEQTTPGTTGDVHYDFTQFALDRSQTRLTNDLRTGMIVDPPNGQLPARVGADAGAAGVGGGRGGRGGGGAAAPGGGGARGGGGGARGGGGAPAAPAAQAGGGGARGGGGGGGGGNATYDAVQNISIGSRCIWTPSAAPIMMPPGYNPAYQIVQGKDAVMILIENQHEVRVIPTNGAQHAPAGVKPWLGDSIGRWEGNSLVVETMNYNPRSLTGTFQGTSESLKVTERFTRIDEDTLKYEFTVEDPKTWVQPWKGEMPFVKINGPVFEHACHEGNYGIANTLSAYRLAEKKAAEEAAAAAGKK